jgi:hypothetical protein
MRAGVVRWLTGYCLSTAVVMPFAAFAQIGVPSEVREEDDEPNQLDVFESLGAESERSRWLLASGWWQDRVRFGATLSTSQKLYGPSDKDGTQLFKPGPESFSVVSEAYATIRLAGDHGIRIGRQSLDLPYLGKHDLRIIPNTFEAVGIGNRPGDGFAYMAGYVDAMKYKDSDEFIAMSEAAGAEGTDDGLTFIGARYRMPDQSVYGILHQRTPDLFETTFAKAEKRVEFTDESSVWADISYTAQRSVASGKPAWETSPPI